MSRSRKAKKKNAGKSNKSRQRQKEPKKIRKMPGWEMPPFPWNDKKVFADKTAPQLRWIFQQKGIDITGKNFPDRSQEVQESFIEWYKNVKQQEKRNKTKPSRFIRFVLKLCFRIYTFLNILCKGLIPKIRS